MIGHLAQSLHHENVKAFLRVIRAGESSQGDEAYRMMFGGKLFDSFDHHPNVKVTANGLTSTAAGAYQFLFRTWAEVSEALMLPDFSPPMQDLAAVYLINRRKALEDVEAGRIEQAIEKCNREWASLPGSPYGQPTRTLKQALATFKEYGGTLNTDQVPPSIPAVPAGNEPETIPAGEVLPDQPSKPMAPIIAALLPSLVEAIPKLGQLFKGSEVAQRNVKAAEIAFSVAKEALGATNEQEVVQRVQADPAAAQAVAKAVEANWYLLTTEAGGGGIEGARAADLKASGGDIRKSASFWISVMLLPIVYLFVLSLTGLVGSATWSDDVRAGLAGSIVSAIIGGLVGYYFGQTTSRNRTPQA